MTVLEAAGIVFPDDDGDEDEEEEYEDEDDYAGEKRRRKEKRRRRKEEKRARKKRRRLEQQALERAMVSDAVVQAMREERAAGGVRKPTPKQERVEFDEAQFNDACRRANEALVKQRKAAGQKSSQYNGVSWNTAS